MGSWRGLDARQSFHFLSTLLSIRKSGPQYFCIPQSTHSSVLDLLSLRRVDLQTLKFRTISRSLQTGNFVLSSLVLGSFMLEEWLGNVILEIVQLCQTAWCHHGAYMQPYSTISILSCMGVGKIINMTQNKTCWKALYLSSEICQSRIAIRGPLA